MFGWAGSHLRTRLHDAPQPAFPSAFGWTLLHAHVMAAVLSIGLGCLVTSSGGAPGTSFTCTDWEVVSSQRTHGPVTSMILGSFSGTGFPLNRLASSAAIWILVVKYGFWLPGSGVISLRLL